MAPLKPIKKDLADKRVQQILDFAEKTSQKLNDRVSISTNTIAELKTFVEQPFPSHGSVSFARSCSEFDIRGSYLWNAATKIIRDVDEDDRSTSKPDLLRFGVLLRTYAFFMLDAAHDAASRRTRDIDQRVRILKIALKASRCCLDNGDVRLAFRIIETASNYVAAWEETTPVIRVTDSIANDEDFIIQRLKCDFHLLRMAHASKSGRYDLAEHFFLKAKINGDTIPDDLLEDAAGICFDIGRSQLQLESSDNAILWLERANELLNSEALASLSLQNEDLRLAIVASLIEALPEDGFGNRAWELVTSLDQDHGLGNRIAVLAMQLNVVTREHSMDVDKAITILSRMIQSTVLTDQTYLTVMRSIHKVRRVNFRAALNALEQLIISRLLPDLDAMDSDQVKDWVQKTIVTYTNLGIAAGKDNTPAVLENIPQIFDLVVQRSDDVLSPKATHAMQALIWKASKDVGSSDRDAWLDLLQHDVFASVGATNKARVARKVMLTALEQEQFNTAQAAFYQMPSPAQNEGMTRYLAYKLALGSGDSQLAGQCLDVLTRNADKDQRYLYACVLEAQKSGNRAIAVAAFQALADQPPHGTQLPALLRCTARLLMQEIEGSPRPLGEITHEMSRTFETAAANIKTLRQGSYEQWRAEIQWWSKNAFNIALRLCAEIQPEHLIRLLRACIHFLDCFPDDAGLMHADELTQRKQVCHFLCGSALVVLGRSSQDRSQQLQNYLEVQREVKEFMAIWQQLHHETPDAELRRTRALEMLKFNVESVFKLEQWDSLDEALTSCLEFQGTARWDTLADLVIIIYDQTSKLSIDSSATAKIPSLLQKIINETWSTDKNVSKIARWLRLTFSISLEHPDGGNSISIKLVGQAASLARRGTERRNDPYPEDELQWLATMAFNKAVDLLAAGDGETAEQWIEASLELARYAADNGSLHALLTRNREEAERRLRQR
ncbi:hypothetical protein Q7P37_003658 [Cladosporium fusiforme]